MENTKTPVKTISMSSQLQRCPEQHTRHNRAIYHLVPIRCYFAISIDSLPILVKVGVPLTSRSKRAIPRSIERMPNVSFPWEMRVGNDNMRKYPAFVLMSFGWIEAVDELIFQAKLWGHDFESLRFGRLVIW